MEPSSPVKVGAAFAAGVAVALGSALVYIRAVDARPHGIVQNGVVQTPAAIHSPARQPDTMPAEEDAAPSAPAVAPGGQAAAKATAKADEEAGDRAGSGSAKPVPLKPVVVRKISNVAARRSRYPESTSTIRVEVSQLNLPRTTGVQALPPPAAEMAPSVFVPQPPGRAVNEDQTQPPAGPQMSVQRQYERAEPAPQQQHVVTLRPGTNLLVRLGETLSTDHNYTGDTFRGSLDAPLVSDGFIIADRGSKVLGRVVNAQKAGHMEGVASLHLTLTEINTTDGQRVRVETGFFDKKGPSAVGEDAAKIAGGAALGAIIGAIAGGGKGAAIGAGAGGAAGTGAVLLGHGKPALLSSETRLSFQLTQPVTITEHLN